MSSRLDINLAWRLLFCIGQITLPCLFNVWSVCALAALKLPAALNAIGHEKLLRRLLVVFDSNEQDGNQSHGPHWMKSVWLKRESPWFPLLISWGLIVFPALAGLHSWSGWKGFLKPPENVFWLIRWGTAKAISACGLVGTSKEYELC